MMIYGYCKDCYCLCWNGLYGCLYGVLLLGGFKLIVKLMWIDAIGLKVLGDYCMM